MARMDGRGCPCREGAMALALPDGRVIGAGPRARRGPRGPRSPACPKPITGLCRTGCWPSGAWAGPRALGDIDAPRLSAAGVTPRPVELRDHAGGVGHAYAGLQPDLTQGDLVGRKKKTQRAPSACTAASRLGGAWPRGGDPRPHRASSFYSNTNFPVLGVVIEAL